VGSALSRLDAAQDVEDQLDDAVVTERAQSNQLAGSSDDDPEFRAMQEIHGGGGTTLSLAVLPRCRMR
jgi:hypothetical protein